MITPEQFQEIGETLLPLLDALTEWIARDMIERFMIRFGRGGARAKARRQNDSRV